MKFAIQYRSYFCAACGNLTYDMISEVSFNVNFICTPTHSQSSRICHLRLMYGKPLVHMRVKEVEKFMYKQCINSTSSSTVLNG